MLSIAEKLDRWQRHTTDSEQLLIINDISWQIYESLCNIFRTNGCSY